MTVACIVAMSENYVIGRSGRLPWHLPADLRRFKRLTMGHAIIMGRRTFESIGRPLPGRTSIVLTRDTSDSAPGVLVAFSLEEAVRRAPEGAQVFVIGGQTLFEEALPRAERLYLTLVHANVDGDVFFPDHGFEGWILSEDERHAPDARNPLPYSFRTYLKETSPTRLDPKRVIR